MVDADPTVEFGPMLDALGLPNGDDLRRLSPKTPFKRDRGAASGGAGSSVSRHLPSRGSEGRRAWAGDLIRRPRQTLIAAGAEGAQDQHAGFGAVPPLAPLLPA